MCGIAGVLNFDLNNIDFEIINKSILNRGPDGNASLKIEELNLNLFHTRLAITDFTDNGKQPFISRNSKYIIIFNGEVYNYKNIRKKLVSENVSFKSSSDTEVLLEAISAWGFDNAIKIIHGMFALCLIDLEKKKIILARDSFGEKHLFFYFKKNQLVFSSEISTIEYFIKSKICSESINKLFKYSYIESPSTIYEDINKLEPGQIIDFDISSSQIKFFSRIHNNASDIFTDLPNKSFKIEKKLQISLSKSIENISKDYEKAIGIFLSSGIDSSLIFTELVKNNSNLKTYTIGFEDEESEIDSAKKISKEFNIENMSEILTEDKVIENLKIFHEVYKEPLCDPSAIPMISLCKLASKDVKVAISGDASDEIFGGYNRYKFYKKILRFSEIILFLRINSIINYFLNIFYPKNKNLKNFLNNISIKNFTKAYEIIFKNNYQEFNNLFLNAEAKYVNDEKINLLDNYLIPNICDIKSYLPDNIFQKTDKASMYFGLEVRTPFTNYELANLAINNYKINNYQNNKKPLLDLLKKNYPDYKERKIKKGFGLPKKFLKKKKIFDFLLYNIHKSILLKNFIEFELINKIINDYKNEPEKNFQKFFTLSIFSLWLNQK